MWAYFFYIGLHCQAQVYRSKIRIVILTTVACYWVGDDEHIDKASISLWRELIKNSEN